MSNTEDHASGASATTEQQAKEFLGGEVREGYAEVGDQRPLAGLDVMPVSYTHLTLPTKA